MPVWIRAVFFLILLPGTVAGWLPWYLAGPDRPAIGTPAAHALGIPIFIAGWMIVVWCARDFVRRGRGTLSPTDPPRALVTNGLYRFSRNPMYVGVILAILGEATWFWSSRVLVYAAIVAVGFHLRVVLVEEGRLAHLFGADYATYVARVPRWIPRPWWAAA